MVGPNSETGAQLLTNAETLPVDCKLPLELRSSWRFKAREVRGGACGPCVGGNLRAVRVVAGRGVTAAADNGDQPGHAQLRNAPVVAKAPGLCRSKCCPAIGGWVVGKERINRLP